MPTEKIIKKVYKILKNVTPLKNDCGIICGGECCKGDSETGMLLFPGEEKILKNVDGFTIVEDGAGRQMLICNGKCNRNYRPIACRIFPLFPLLVDDRIYIIDDPRAKGLCPLIYDEMKLNKAFERKVGKAGKLLSKNTDTYEYLKSVSEEICEIISMTQDFLG